MTVQRAEAILKNRLKRRLEREQVKDYYAQQEKNKS